MKIRPAMFRWTPEGHMVPHGRFAELCKRQFVAGEDYALGPVENIPGNSRAPLFIAAKEAWQNMPEDDDRFPTADHLRKRALVAAGWAEHQQFVMDTPKDAKQMARGLRGADGYAVIVVKGNVVDVWSPKSIAAGQITAEDWKTVKPAALDWIAKQANTTRAELERHSSDGGAR